MIESKRARWGGTNSGEGIYLSSCLYFTGTAFANSNLQRSYVELASSVSPQFTVKEAYPSSLHF
jgi:hypothetical protein